jgi:plastocyanin
MTDRRRLSEGHLLLLIGLILGGHNLAAAQGKSTAEIRGRITITRKAESAHTPAVNRYPGHGTHEVASGGAPAQTSEGPLPERTVVYLESETLNRGKYPLPSKNPILDQKNLQFHPRVLPILVGTTVDFPNRDNLFHNVFSYSQPGEFDLGRYPRDDVRSVQFDRTGLVRVYCDIHAHMNATIIVLPHPYFATPGDDGSYAIRRVPEGKYSVVLWIDRDVVDRRSVEVRSGETAQIDFTD